MIKKSYFELFLFIIILIMTIIASFLSLKESFLIKTQGIEKISGINAPIKIARDKFGVAHIYASSREDLYFGLGYSMSQDRLFQMDLLRRSATGRLSEIFGASALEKDKLARSFMIHRKMQEYLKFNYKNLDAQMILSLESFMNGINEFIASEKYPVEYYLLDIKPEKFTLADILSVCGKMSLSFAQGFKQDVLFTSFSDYLSNDMFKSLTGLSRPILKNKAVSLKVGAEERLKSFFNDTPVFLGSNAFAISGRNTFSRSPILYNDPHIPFTTPGVWYEAHLSSPEFELYGHFLPLVPFSILGHNEFLGWGVTMSTLDDMDVFIEKKDPKNNNLITYKGKKRELNEYEEIIQIKNASAYVFKVKEGPHGPIIDDFFEPSPHYSYSLRWSFFEKNNHFLESLFKINMAKNIDEFRKPLRNIRAPGLNFIYADTKGNIAHWIVGDMKVPVKHDKYRFVLNGWDGKNDAIKLIPFNKKPHKINPEDGYIVSANNRLDNLVQSQGYWEPDRRKNRIFDTLISQQYWSTEDIKKVANDNYFVDFDKYLDVLMMELDKTYYFQDNLSKHIFRHLNSWDGKSRITSIGSLVFYSWIKEIINTVLEQNLTENDKKRICETNVPFKFLERIFFDAQSKWWDDPYSEDVENRGFVITKAYKKMVFNLKHKLGPEVSLWQWGQKHQLFFNHVLGSNIFLSILFNRGPYASSGAHQNVLNFKEQACDPSFKIVSGPSTKRLISFDSLDNTLGILPLGNSGNPFNTHYDDQADLFFKDQFRPQQLKKFQDLEGAIKLLELEPI